MKVAIAYYSRHHGITKKLLDAIKEYGDVSLIDVNEQKEADLSDYDFIGLASGTYLGRLSTELVNFTKNNLPSDKPVFLIITYGLQSADTKGIKKIIEEKSCRLMGTYRCRGYLSAGPFRLFGGVAKGHPDESDVKGAVEFFKKIIQPAD